VTSAPQFPVSLMVEGRPCLVVGGGRIAARKVDGLRACAAKVHVVAPEVSDEIKAWPDVSWEQRPYRRGEVGRYRLAVSATSSPEVNRAVYLDAEEAGVWVNGADDPQNCSFTLPSIVRRGPLTVAISTGGGSPALAAWLKGRLETTIGPEYEVLLDLLATERRSQQANGRSTESLDWKKALDSDMLDLIRVGDVAHARERLQTCLSSSSD